KFPSLNPPKKLKFSLRPTNLPLTRLTLLAPTLGLPSTLNQPMPQGMSQQTQPPGSPFFEMSSLVRASWLPCSWDNCWHCYAFVFHVFMHWNTPHFSLRL